MPATTTIARAMRRLGYDPTLFGYTDQAVDPRTVARRQPVAAHLRRHPARLRPSAGAPAGKPGAVARLAEISAVIATPEDFWDMYLPATGGLASGRATHRRAMAPTRRETAFLTDAFLGWLADAADERALVRTHLLSRAAPALTSCRNRSTRSTIPPPARHSGAGRQRDAERRVGPSDHRLLARPGRGESDTLRHRRAAMAGGGLDAMTISASCALGLLGHDQRGRRCRSAVCIDGLAAAGAAGDTVVVAHLGSWRDAGRPLGARQVRLFRSVLPRAARSSADPRQSARRGRVDAFTESVDIMPTHDRARRRAPAAASSTAARSVPFLAGRTSRRPGATRFIGNTIFARSRPRAAQRALGLDLDACSLAVHPRPSASSTSTSPG